MYTNKMGETPQLTSSSQKCCTLRQKAKDPVPARSTSLAVGLQTSIKTLRDAPPYQEGMGLVIWGFLVLFQNYLIHSTNTY